MDKMNLLKRLLQVDGLFIVKYPAVEFAMHGRLPENLDRLDFVAARDFKGACRAVAGLCGGSFRMNRLRHAMILKTDRLRIKVGRPRRYSGGSNPAATMTPILEDLMSRGITMNAVAADKSGVLLDPMGGSRDYAQGVLRTIQAPGELFTYHPYWLLKIAAIQATMGFDLSDDVVKAARRNSINVVSVRPDMARRLMQRIIMDMADFKPFEYLYHSGILRVLLPEVAGMKKFDRTMNIHHKDLWDHTLRVILNIPREPVLRWTALLHDIGKLATRRVKDGVITFYRHEEVGAVLFRGIAARLAFPDEEAELIGYLIARHSRINHYTEEWTDSGVRRLIRDVGDRLDYLLKFSRADITSKNEKRVRKLGELSDQLENRIDHIMKKDSAPPLLPSGLGNRIMEVFGLKPGPVIGKIRKALEARVKDGTLPGNTDYDIYIDYIKKESLHVN